MPWYINIWISVVSYQDAYFLDISHYFIANENRGKPAMIVLQLGKLHKLDQTEKTTKVPSKTSGGELSLVWKVDRLIR